MTMWAQAWVSRVNKDFESLKKAGCRTSPRANAASCRTPRVVLVRRARIRCPSPQRLGDVTPEEAWSGNKPDISRLRVLGSREFVYIPSRQIVSTHVPGACPKSQGLPSRPSPHAPLPWIPRRHLRCRGPGSNFVRTRCHRTRRRRGSGCGSRGCKRRECKCRRHWESRWHIRISKATKKLKICS